MIDFLQGFRHSTWHDSFRHPRTARTDCLCIGRNFEQILAHGSWSPHIRVFNFLLIQTADVLLMSDLTELEENL